MKIVAPKRQAHIMHKKIKVIFLKFFGISDTISRNVNTGNCKAHRSQYFTMSSFAAGYIQHTVSGNRLQMFYEFFNKRGCFLFISFEI